MAASLRSALPSRAVGAPALAARARPAATTRAEGAERAAERGVASLGIAALVVSTVLFPLSDMIAKTLSVTYAGLEVAWMRYAAMFALVAPLVARRPGLLRTGRPGLQVARGVAAVAATALALAGFARLPLADATAIAFCAPMIVTGLAALVLKEHVGAVRWAAAASGFAGILVIVRPGAAGFEPAAILPLLSSVFSAVTIVLTRLGRNERAETTMVFTTLVGFAGLSGPVMLVWQTPDAPALWLGFAMGLLAAAASLLQMLAYRCAPASLLAPFSYGQIVWAMAIGWLFTGAAPGVVMLAGSAIVIASGVAAGWQGPAAGGRRDWPAIRRQLTAPRPAARA